LIAAGISAASTLAGCGTRNPSAVAKTHTFREHAFGTSISLSVTHRDVNVANKGLLDAFGQLQLVESLMSIYDPNSQLSRLNRDKVLDSPHPYLVDILRQSVEVSRRSNGAFDVTVQPIWDLWQRVHNNRLEIDRMSLQSVCRNVDWRRINITDSRITIHPQTQITLNGIAQGYAADKAAAALLPLGIMHALLDTGEISATGNTSATEITDSTSDLTAGCWRIGIQHPRVESAYVAIAGLENRCLATSGDYETTFSEDYRDHHLLDPATGRSPSELSSVSVVAPTATLSDALSTAAFVMGPERGSEFINRTPGADALFVLKNQRVLKTAGFPLVLDKEFNS
jgi:thiamine biosynthesis lipoprotein